jgi:WD40 repeat protein
VILTGPSGRHVLRQHRASIDSVAFSPDGTRLVTGSVDHDALVFDVATGAMQHVLRGHGGAVTDARFSPDSRWIVTAGPTTAGLWSASTGKLVELLKGPTSLLTAAAFTPDSRGIVTRERNGVVRRAECSVCGDVDELLALARERLEATGRALTEAERRKYLG